MNYTVMTRETTKWIKVVNFYFSPPPPLLSQTKSISKKKIQKWNKRKERKTKQKKRFDQPKDDEMIVGNNRQFLTQLLQLVDVSFRFSFRFLLLFCCLCSRFCYICVLSAKFLWLVSKLACVSARVCVSVDGGWGTKVNWCENGVEIFHVSMPLYFSKETDKKKVKEREREWERESKLTIPPCGEISLLDVLKVVESRQEDSKKKERKRNRNRKNGAQFEFDPISWNLSLPFCSVSFHFGFLSQRLPFGQVDHLVDHLVDQRPTIWSSKSDFVKNCRHRMKKTTTKCRDSIWLTASQRDYDSSWWRWNRPLTWSNEFHSIQFYWESGYRGIRVSGNGIGLKGMRSLGSPINLIRSNYKKPTENLLMNDLKWPKGKTMPRWPN